LKCVFRLEWKVRNQQETAEEELTERNSFISETTDLIDWLNAASVKVRSAPSVGSRVDGKIVQRLISEHKVMLSALYCDFDLYGSQQQQQQQQLLLLLLLLLDSRFIEREKLHKT